MDQLLAKLWLETKIKPSEDTLKSQKQLKVDFKAKMNRQHKQNATKKVPKVFHFNSPWHTSLSLPVHTDRQHC